VPGSDRNPLKQDGHAVWCAACATEPAPVPSASQPC
jgi:hypothetical protein